MRVTAATLREMSSVPELNRVFMTKMTERMVRMDMIEMPKMLTLDQSLLRELRTETARSGTRNGRNRALSINVRS